MTNQTLPQKLPPMKPVTMSSYEGRYSVTTTGLIYSHFSNKWLKQHVDKDGYKIVILSKNGIHNLVKVHRLVGMAFIDNPENKPQINHKLGNKSNNYYKNLEWATAKENVQHAFDTGLKTVSDKARKLFIERTKKRFTNRKDTIGSLNGRAKLSENDVLMIRKRILANDNMSQIARDYSVTPNCIFEIKTRKRWSHI